MTLKSTVVVTARRLAGAATAMAAAKLAAVRGPGLAMAAVMALAVTVTATATPAEAQVYRLYVANESADMVSRVAFSEDRGAWVEQEIPVGLLPGDIDGAHGITVSDDAQYWYVTIAHGSPYGSVWKFAAGPDTLVGKTELGHFPATMGITPDGQFLLAVNFNLHGDMVPSNVSVVYTPTMQEISKIETCLMPHGSRMNVSGSHQYSACMHSEQLVEISVDEFAVSKRFDLTPGSEGVLGGQAMAGHGAHGESAAGMGEGMAERDAAGAMSGGMDHGAHAAARTCSPTWVEPGEGPLADRFVYIACNKDGHVLEVDVTSWEVTRRFATGKAPYNLDVTANGDVLVATLKGEQAVAVFDLESGEEVARIPTSQPVTHGVVTSPDGRFAFISNEAIGSVKGTLDVIDLENLELVDTVELGHQSGGIDYWFTEDPSN